MKGLVIRQFGSKYALCDGKSVDGQDGYCLGTVVAWYDTWQEADDMRALIKALYT